MSSIDLILLQRVEKLGQMGDRVQVRPGYARNFLLPKHQALRATASNLAHFERERARLEANNLRHREEAELVAERIGGMSITIIRQAGESGGLYGSVSTRDISDASRAYGLSIGRAQVVLSQPIKSLGLTSVRIVLHPEVITSITVNVARSIEEADRQARDQLPSDAEEQRLGGPDEAVILNDDAPN